jgi:uncharacterized cupredoxin-like copper-binding protein
MRKLALALLVTAVVGCGGGSSGSAAAEADASSGRVSTELRDAQRYVPNRFVNVKPGARVTVELKNTGNLVHSFQSNDLGVPDAVKVDPGKTGSVTFTAPAAAGSYKFQCTEPGHAEAGMTGEVVVQ